MAAFAPNNTPRLWVRYTSAGKEHEILFRGTQQATVVSLTNEAAYVCDSMRPLMRALDSFQSARYAERLSDFSVPVVWVPQNGTGSNDLGTGDPESFFIDWVGRDYTFGSKVHWTLFTASSDAPRPAINRVPQGANVAIDAVITALQNAANEPASSDRITTISQGQPVVYPYANTGFNAYWQRQQRTQG